MVRVKICGITTLEEALAAVDCGAHALGFVFAESPRRVDPVQVRRIVRKLPPFVCKVGVFVNARRDDVFRLAAYCGLDALQFHGEEGPEYCRGWRWPVIKAFRVRDRSFIEEITRYRVSACLLDAFVPGRRGGTGVSFNWQLARDAGGLGRIVLAGGLSPDNVEEAIRTVHPFAIDVSSGVETGGKKDPEKMRALMAAVRRADDGIPGL